MDVPSRRPKGFSSSMHNHAPDGYECPFCWLAQGRDTDLSGQDDLVYRDDQVLALVSIDWWPNNPGHVLVVPVPHHENVYDLPEESGTPLQSVIRRVALAMKDAYGCTGISIRQHNEPDGMQDVWHYHVHVVPRFADDKFLHLRPVPNTAQERRPYVELLRKRLVAMA
jgi:histidine triad (HIT) family protein